MQNIISNHLKASLLVGDITNESAHYYQSDCMTVQKFSYTVGRTLDKVGIPYGSPNITTLTATVRIGNRPQVKRFFDMMEKMNSNDFSFLFNTNFNPDRSIRNQDDAIVLQGIVVGINEQFKSVAGQNNQQMLLTFKILVSKITYIGSMSNKVLTLSEI